MLKLPGLLDLGPAIAHCHGAIEDRIIVGRIIVADEISQALELQVRARRGVAEAGFDTGAIQKL